MIDFSTLGLPENPIEFELSNGKSSQALKLRVDNEELWLVIFYPSESSDLKYEKNEDFPHLAMLTHYHYDGNPLFTGTYSYYKKYLFSASKSFSDGFLSSVNTEEPTTDISKEQFINLVSNKLENVKLLDKREGLYAYNPNISEESLELFSSSSNDANAPPIIGVGENIESDFAPSDFNNVNPDLSEFYPSIGYITDNYGFLCTAFVLKNNIAITARHALNGKILNQLQLHLPHYTEEQKEFYFSNIIERGEQLLESSESISNQEIMPDYILLNVSTDEQLPELSLSIDTLVNTQNYYAIGYDDTSDEPTISTLPTNLVLGGNAGDDLVITYTANTGPGFSGAPFINPQGQVLGLHCRTSLEALFEEQRTALSFRYVTQNHPTSAFASVLSDKPYQPPSVGMIAPLPVFDTVIEGLQEREEAQIRLEALGETPSLGNSHTYRCMLARWLLKVCTDKKIQFKAIAGDNTKIVTLVFNQGTPNKKLSYFKITKGALEHSITKDDLEKLASGTPIIGKNDNERKLINHFFAPEYWEVKVRKTAGAAREWVVLTGKNGNQPAIHMGHKLAAIEYWLFGSKDYQAQCVAKKMSTPKYNQGTNTQKQKTKDRLTNDYSIRYKKYETAGYLMYGTPINQQLMQDPENYRFEWGRLNSSEGKKLANDLGMKKLGKTGKNHGATFADKCPLGLKFKNNAFVPQ